MIIIFLFLEIIVVSKSRYWIEISSYFCFLTFEILEILSCPTLCLDLNEHQLAVLRPSGHELINFF